mmetsp:Transcript_54064/g.124474  ORF Transcript_54064/g.124474 Transcript_54064/m.124474 type:complete len:255 (-) Transcript_54064:735-1499(-)
MHCANSYAALLCSAIADTPTTPALVHCAKARCDLASSQLMGGCFSALVALRIFSSSRTIDLESSLSPSAGCISSIDFSGRGVGEGEGLGTTHTASRRFSALVSSPMATSSKAFSPNTHTTAASADISARVSPFSLAVGPGSIVCNAIISSAFAISFFSARSRAARASSPAARSDNSVFFLATSQSICTSNSFSVESLTAQSLNAARKFSNKFSSSSKFSATSSAFSASSQPKPKWRDFLRVLTADSRDLGASIC